MIKGTFVEKNHFKILILNQRGVSIPEILLSAAIVATTALSVGYVYSNSVGRVKSVEAARETVFVHTGVVSRIRQVLLDTKDAKDKSTQGLCGLITSDALASGIAQINISFANDRVTKNFSQDKWLKYFGDEWQVSKSNRCPKTDAFVKCFEPKVNSRIDLSGRADSVQELILVAKILPADLDPEDKSRKPFEEISGFLNKSFDAKKIAFFVESEVKFKKPDSQGKLADFRSYAREIVWAADVGTCYKALAGGKEVYLSPSGSGLGDSDGVVVYNNPNFFKDVTTDPLRDSAFKRIVV